MSKEGIEPSTLRFGNVHSYPLSYKLNTNFSFFLFTCGFMCLAFLLPVFFCYANLHHTCSHLWTLRVNLSSSCFTRATSYSAHFHFQLATPSRAPSCPFTCQSTIGKVLCSFATKTPLRGKKVWGTYTCGRCGVRVFYQSWWLHVPHTFLPLLAPSCPFGARHGTAPHEGPKYFALTCRAVPILVAKLPAPHVPRAPLGQEDVAKVKGVDWQHLTPYTSGEGEGEGAPHEGEGEGVAVPLLAPTCPYLPLLAPTCPYLALRGTARHGTARHGTALQVGAREGAL